MEVKKRTQQPVDLMVKSNSVVCLTITIGNRQIGGGILQYEGEDEPFAKGRIKKVLLDKGKNLADRVLVVETNVLDSNTETNNIVITHRFHYDDDSEIRKIVIEDKVDNHKDILSSLATYNFKIINQ